MVGQHGNAIKVKLKARPIEGEANAALCKFLAEELGIPERSVVLERGRKSRDKIVRIEVLTKKQSAHDWISMISEQRNHPCRQ